MKICGNCGASNTDDSLFCVGCGKELKAEKIQEQTEQHQKTDQQSTPAYAPPVFSQEQQPYYQQPAESSYTYANSVSGNPNAIQRIREMMASPLILIVSVLMFVQLILSKISGYFVKQDANSLFKSANSFQINTTSFLFGFIFTGLIVVGLLMIYVSAKNNNSDLPTTGISLIRVVSIISLVCICIVVAALLIVSCIIIGGSTAIANDVLSVFKLYDWTGEAVSILGVVIFVFSLIIGTIGIIFIASAISFLGGVKKTIQTGILSTKGAGVFSVFCFIFGSFAALGTLATLSTFATNSNPAAGILNFLSAAAGTANYFLFGLIASKYKNLARPY